MMPEMNGYEVTTRLKENPETRDIPIILITALDSINDKIKGLEVGADEFINKPVRFAELISRVKSLVRFKQYQDELKSHGQLIGDSLNKEQKNIPALLIVEDNDYDAKVLKGYLQNELYQIHHAESGEDALATLSLLKTDLILLDILLPNMDGFEVINRIREMESVKHVQILAITNLQDLESKVKGLELGADDYLTKPVNRHELQLRIRTLLRKKAYLDTLYEITHQI
jgi:two-component system cell cycle response regulator